jgi:uncharacterized damage-inducible protein DinB
MAYQNAWANHRLAKACGRLSQAEFVAQLDEFFCAGEAALRAEDFAELGWTEEQVWGT